MNNPRNFTGDEQQLLRRIAEGMIPPMPEKGLPGADDDQIFQRLLSSAVEQLAPLQNELAELMQPEGGISAANTWSDEQFDAWFSHWEQQWPHNSHGLFQRLTPLIMRAYYQDPRVHSAYDRRPGPPFPEGYVIIEGDWSLLDKVRGREPLYRE